MYTYICIKCVLIYVPIYAIIYIDKGKADNPQTAERLIKMKKFYFYRVEFYIKKCGEHHYFYYCMAHNANEARNVAKLYWNSSYHYSRMFHITVSRVSPNDFKNYNIFTFYRICEY